MLQRQHGWRWTLALAAASIAVAAPTLLLAGAHPLVGLPTDLLALLGWGLWAVHVGHLTPQDNRLHVVDSGQTAALALLFGLGLAAALGVMWDGSPRRLVARQGSVLPFAAVVLMSSACLMRREGDGQWRHAVLVRAIFIALVFAGAANALIAWLQFFAPASVLAGFPPDGRATGNLRQPNLLASLVLMALVATVACRQALRWPLLVFVGLYGLLVFALALSLSRMGALATLLPALWGLLDRQLKRSTRWALMLLPFALAVSWGAVLAMQQAWGLGVSAGVLHDRTSLTSSRWGLWRQSMQLILQNPWFGVGWGQFNFAWTLTAMPQGTRSPNEMFTHAHNLLLQWAVELGIPAALALTGLLAWAVWRGWQLAQSASGTERLWRTAAWVAVLIVLVHSQLEFPLWQAGFLLTTACLAGIALGPRTTNGKAGDRARPAAASDKRAPRLRRAGIAAGLLLLAAGWAAQDYQPISQLYAPSDNTLTDDQRVQAARRSVLFGQFGDRYAGTLARRGQRTLAPYCDVVFEQLDVQLLFAWTLAQAEAGDMQKAQYLAARLKEFDRPLTRSFFAVCEGSAGAQAFQCTPPRAYLGFRDLRPGSKDCGR